MKFRRFCRKSIRIQKKYPILSFKFYVLGGWGGAKSFEIRI